VWITGGTTPGQTTDAVLVQLSRRLDIPTLINATNIPYIYDIASGTVNKNRPIQDMTWDQYLTLLGNREHEPGENVPFGIAASHKAQTLGLSVIVLDGNNLSNLQRVFEGKPFEGTIIHS
jgi:uridylate kinase